ncbi:hypothetical protein SNEBB_011175 [Seison nebaliae]|nr:hypothetical protein SNEBB_011175 [Seison nebaliae]
MSKFKTPYLSLLEGQHPCTTVSRMNSSEILQFLYKPLTPQMFYNYIKNIPPTTRPMRKPDRNKLNNYQTKYPPHITPRTSTAKINSSTNTLLFSLPELTSRVHMQRPLPSSLPTKQQSYRSLQSSDREHIKLNEMKHNISTRKLKLNKRIQTAQYSIRNDNLKDTKRILSCRNKNIDKKQLICVTKNIVFTI